MRWRCGHDVAFHHRPPDAALAVIGDLDVRPAFLEVEELLGIDVAHPPGLAALAYP